MNGVYDMLDALFQHERREGKNEDGTHFNSLETPLPRSSVQVEASDISSWQISVVEGRISIG